MSTMSTRKEGASAISCNASAVSAPYMSASQAQGTIAWFISPIGPQAAQPYSVNISGQQRTAIADRRSSCASPSRAWKIDRLFSSCGWSTSARPAIRAPTVRFVAATVPAGTARARSKSDGSATRSTSMPASRFSAPAS